MILQTLYQNCVKHGVEFFNEFYVLDLLMTGAPTAGRAGPPASSPTSWPPARSTSSRPSRSCSPPAAPARSSRPPPTRTPSPVTAWASCYRRGLPLEDMEFFQFHPTGSGRPGHPALGGAPAARAASCATPTASASWSATRPTIKDLAPRDMVARSMANEVREGRGCGPEQGLRLPRPDAPAAGAASTPSCPTSPSSPAPTWASSRTPSRCRSTRPRTTRWAASPPTSRREVLRRQHDRRPRPVRRRRGRLRLRARRQPAGHQLAARHQRLRPARRHRRRRVRRDAPTSSSCRRTRRRSSIDAGRATARLRRATSGSPTIRRRCRRPWTSTRRCSAPSETLKQALERHRRPAGALPARVRSRTRASASTPTCSRPSSWASCSTSPRSWSSSALARKESRGGHFREDYPNRDDVNFMRHTMAYREVGDGRRPRPIRLDYKPVVQTRYQPMERKY